MTITGGGYLMSSRRKVHGTGRLVVPLNGSVVTSTAPSTFGAVTVVDEWKLGPIPVNVMDSQFNAWPDTGNYIARIAPLGTITVPINSSSSVSVVTITSASNFTPATVQSNTDCSLPALEQYYGEQTFNLSNANINYWASGAAIPAGTYRITYKRGAWRPWNGDPQGGWCVISKYPGSDPHYGGYIKYNNGAASIVAPGAIQHFTSAILAESASVNAFIDITHTGGTIGIYLYDVPHFDNAGTTCVYALSRIS